MYTEVNAKIYHKWVRTFFDGPEHSGAKSDNKKYAAEPIEGITLKEGQVKHRNDNIAIANKTRQTINEIRAKFSNAPTPAQMGEVIFKQKLRGGNCAEMTWLCCYSFSTKKLNIWIGIIDDPGDHQFCILSEKPPAAVPIRKMDYMGEDQWIIDPWANIVCKPGEFATKFTEKMQRWTDRGKRIGVPNEKKTAYNWTPGNDPGYLKAILDSGITLRKGWAF